MPSQPVVPEADRLPPPVLFQCTTHDKDSYISAVSYTHLDVYKRQIVILSLFGVLMLGLIVMMVAIIGIAASGGSWN